MIASLGLGEEVVMGNVQEVVSLEKVRWVDHEGGFFLEGAHAG